MRAEGGWRRIRRRAINPAGGRFDTLQERNRTILQGLLEAASSNKPTRTATEQKIGDYFASCMDTKALDAKGPDADTT